MVSVLKRNDLITEAHALPHAPALKERNICEDDKPDLI